VGTLNQGADDFLAKPFDLAELQARLHALIRRARQHPRTACGPLAWDATTKAFTLGTEPLALTPREHAALRVLIQHLGEPLSKTEILDRVVSDAHDVSPRPSRCWCTACASAWTAAACASPRCAAWATCWRPRRDAGRRQPARPAACDGAGRRHGAGLGHRPVGPAWRTAAAAANAAYDRSLAGAIKAIDANISTASGGLGVELPYAMLEFFELTAGGRGVLSRRQRRRPGRDRQHRPAQAGPAAAAPAGFRDARYHGQPLRLGSYTRVLDPPLAGHAQAARDHPGGRDPGLAPASRAPCCWRPSRATRCWWRWRWR
jgi:hypothetical protein